ncbi:type III secretion system export apparatus subunit SctR [Chitinimonas koreensis]|uniref:type III secretion system export apparatus subunit SctR n=1 Tax=Chitinimonas koreensis TaxID=356302 RepID=UPI0004141AE0|nr:type III secretion system export apparatus subunit SctR [Chitinimonas koreensis]QNM97645.1 type III secretion system export apparatus subunit SctR [Chitinimonas koreensis]
MSAAGFDPFSLALVLALLAVLPLLLMVTTCFLKVAVVLMLVRNAMGVQQAPPSMAIYAMAMVLTLFVMSPTLQQMGDRFRGEEAGAVAGSVLDRVERAATPLRGFMLKHTKPEQSEQFLATARKLWGAEAGAKATREDLLILIPAFVVSELQTGFEIGFLLYIPFVVIDLVVSNILLALGMQMVSPSTVSLPLKILLFVMVDGWGKLLHGLALSYL